MSEVTLAGVYSFQDEFEKLLAILPKAATSDVSRSAADAYQRAYAKTLPERHIKYFKAVYDQAAIDIVTETSPGQWLEGGAFSILFGGKKNKSGAALHLSEIYRQAKMGPGGGDDPMIPLYPKIILLHLYRIFVTIEPNDAIKRKIALLEQDLRGIQPQSGFEGIQQYIGPLMEMFKNNFGPMTGSNAKVVDSIMGVVKSPELASSLNDVSGSLNDLMSVGPAMLPALMEQLSQVQAGKTDVMTGLANLLKHDALKEHQAKLDAFKPLMNQAAKLMDQQGIEMPPAFKGDLSNVSLADVLTDVMNTPDVKRDIQEFNEKATAVARDPSKIASLMGAAMPPPAAMSRTAGPSQEQLESVQQMLAQIPPDQLRAMLAQMNLSGR